MIDALQSSAIRTPVAIRDGAPSAQETKNDSQLRAKAEQFEAVFIQQMLKHSGFSKALGQNSGFGGEAFSDMLAQQYADQIAANGGFGLADKIYAQLAAREDGHAIQNTP